MEIAFTGTERSMTPAQFERVTMAIRHLAKRATAHRLHHGACVGADREVHTIAYGQNIRRAMHPSNQEQLDWAKRNKLRDDEIEILTPPLTRNRIMVNWGDILVAAPAAMEEVLRSGTWMTIRYARQQKKPIIICWPDGTATLE